MMGIVVIQTLTASIFGVGESQDNTRSVVVNDTQGGDERSPLD